MMERALKERIIGAIVLVALVVLVVPVFLDGPPDSGEIISERVPLPGQSDQKSQTVVLDRDRSEPVPQSSSAPDTQAPETSTPEPLPAVAKPAVEVAREKPQPVVAKAEPDEPEVEATNSPVVRTPASTSATGMFAVQLGSFSNQENAERLAADLRKQGFAAFLSQLSTSSGQLHRVRVGPQKDREAAVEMAARLEKAGHNGKVLPHP